MPRKEVPFIGPAYQARSLNASAQRAVNCYLEAGADGAHNALYGTPGTVLRASVGVGPIRGGIVSNGFSWFVSRNQVYRVSSSYVSTLCGTISSLSGPISMAANDSQIIIVDGTAGYLINTTTAVVAAISDPDFPNGVTQSTYQDGFFIVAGDGTGKFYINEQPNNGAAWNGLDFASAEGSPDNTISVISSHRELWLVGSDSAEIWINTGNADFPFERSGNVFIEHGCAAPFTLDKIDNTVFWLGSDSRGQGTVWRANGYTPQRISTHAIEYAISRYSRIDDAYSLTYQQEGHLFYVLTFPTGNQTWVYDAATNEWHERAAFNHFTSELSRWNPSCHVFFNGKHLVGDSTNGNIYSLEMDVYTDNGDPIKRIRSAMTISDKQLRQFFSMLQVVMESGVGDLTTPNPLLMLRYSNDNGHTWSDVVTGGIGKTVGSVGEYGKRVIYRRLGSGRNRVWEVSMTDPVKFAVIGALIEYENGNA